MKEIERQNEEQERIQCNTYTLSIRECVSLFGCCFPLCCSAGVWPLSWQFGMLFGGAVPFWCGLNVRQGYACVFRRYMSASRFLTCVFWGFLGVSFGVSYICAAILVFFSASF